ncbi:hypothetical protein SGRIM128S_02150 [Streptomyces griseomycini]
MAGDAARPRTSASSGLGAKWGAMGTAVCSRCRARARTPSPRRCWPLPASGCVNVDAAAVVRRGGPPAGAHSDILHAELARLVLAAGRIR